MHVIKEFPPSWKNLRHPCQPHGERCVCCCALLLLDLFLRVRGAAAVVFPVKEVPRAGRADLNRGRTFFTWSRATFFDPKARRSENRCRVSAERSIVAIDACGGVMASLEELSVTRKINYLNTNESGTVILGKK